VITKAHEEAAVHALRSEKFIDGESTYKFKTALQMKFGRKYCSLCNSGTSALSIAIRAAIICHYIASKSKIFTTPLSFISTATAITMSGCTPVFRDVDEYGMMTPSYKDGVHIPVALYGKRYPYIDECKGVVIEDDAQAHGTHNLNTLANCFSFYTTKNLTVCGNGGAILTDDEKFHKVIESLINNGRVPGKNYEHQYVSSSYRINNINAALGMVNLKLLHDQITQRRFFAATYNSTLMDLPQVQIISEPVHDHTFHLYVIKVHKKLRDDLRNYLYQHKIETGVHYPYLIYQQQPYLSFAKKLPKAEKMVKEIISLPMHNKLTFDDVMYVANTIRSFFGYEKI